VLAIPDRILEQEIDPFFFRAWRALCHPTRPIKALPRSLLSFDLYLLKENPRQSSQLIGQNFWNWVVNLVSLLWHGGCRLFAGGLGRMEKCFNGFVRLMTGHGQTIGENRSSQVQAVWLAYLETIERELSELKALLCQQVMDCLHISLLSLIQERGR
jgi:hypothetical protein